MSNLWIILRQIVIYLAGRKCYLRGLFCCYVNGSDVPPDICPTTLVCFNIQTSHGFENFCLLSSNSTYSFRIKWYNLNMCLTACFHYIKMSLLLTLYLKGNFPASMSSDYCMYIYRPWYILLYIDVVQRRLGNKVHILLFYNSFALY